MIGRTIIVLSLALGAACAPAPSEQASSSQVAILEPAFAVKARTYVMIDPDAPSGDAGVAHYLPIMAANDEALLCSLVERIGSVTLLGGPRPYVLEHGGDRYLYDYEQLLLMDEPLSSLEAQQVVPDAAGTLQLDLLRPLRTNTALVQEPCRWRSRLPRRMSQTDTTPYGFERAPTTLTPTENQGDAWPDVAALFEGGVLDIDVHFGALEEYKHLAPAYAFIEWLVAHRYRWPGRARSPADIDTSSGPFVRALQTPWGPVQVEVRVYFGRPGTETDPARPEAGQALAELARTSLATRDVVVFIGHDWGYESAAWNTGLDRTIGIQGAEFATLPLAGHGQVIVSEGCWTAALSGAMRLNPAVLQGARLDHVASASRTLVSSDAVARATVQLLAQDDGPERYLTMLRELKKSSEERIRLVDFLDDNPTRHPYADPARLGVACTGPPDCGRGAACVPLGAERRCAPECTRASACDDDLACRPVPGARGDDPPSYCQPAL